MVTGGGGWGEVRGICACARFGVVTAAVQAVNVAEESYRPVSKRIVSAGE